MAEFFLGMKKELCLLGCLLFVSSGCSSSKELRQTQVVTFPKGGIVEYNGKRMGQEPVMITLPQDEKGNIAARSVIRASPTEGMKFAETKILEPGNRLDRVPDRIMLDLSPYVEMASGAQSDSDQGAEQSKARPRAESPRGRSNR